MEYKYMLLLLALSCKYFAEAVTVPGPVAKSLFILDQNVPKDRALEGVDNLGLLATLLGNDIEFETITEAQVVVNPLFGPYCDSRGVSGPINNDSTVFWCISGGQNFTCDCLYKGAIGLGPGVPDVCSCATMLDSAVGDVNVDVQVTEKESEKMRMLELGGTMYSLPVSGQCNGPVKHDVWRPCAWKINVVEKKFQYARVVEAFMSDLNSTIVGKTSCLTSCSAKDRGNVTSQCWLSCLSNALFQSVTQNGTESVRAFLTTTLDHVLQNNPCERNTHPIKELDEDVAGLQNITMIRITSPNIKGLANVDTADVAGDMFFGLFELLLTKGGPAGHGPFSPEGALINKTALYQVSTVQVNSLFGPYAMCNPIKQNGTYQCKPEWHCVCSLINQSATALQDNPMELVLNHSTKCPCIQWGGGMGHGGSPTRLGHAVGRVSLLSQWGPPPGAGPSIPVCHSMTDPSLCNHTHGCTYNASLSSCVTKFDNDIALARIAEQIQGLWFSTPAQGQCNGAHSSEYNSSVLPCTWLELQRQNINASCVNDLVIDGIWKYTKPYGLQCRIDNCGASGATNQSLPCYQECLVSALLGDIPNTTAIPQNELVSLMQSALDSNSTCYNHSDFNL
eukprot:m.41856 g.41856  ORF g.41856 m.41856 type:complete len:621 (-) comp9818_c0_seq4:35-1897(-)